MDSAFHVSFCSENLSGAAVRSIPARPEPKRRPPMRKILLALSLLVFRAARADDAATHPAYWGSPSVDGGKCCETLAEVRQNIDRIDHAIVAKVRADAEAQGLDATVAERTYRAMIAAFEDFERAEWTRRSRQMPAK